MRLTARLAIAPAVAISLAASPAFAASQLVRVPGDAKDLQTAVGLVADGGVVELAAGSYATPPRGFAIGNLRKQFTVRAVGAVVLDGGGSHLLLRVENGTRDRGKLVSFEGITFRNGSSLEEGMGGAVTLSAAQARFVGCVFEQNRATGKSTGGGAVRIMAQSDATFVNTTFRANSSLNRGGALEIVDSMASFQGGLLQDNRTNLPGHKATATGGAIHAVDSTLSLSGVRLEGNQAAWVGGAIYAFGHWKQPESTPRTLLEVHRSTFAGNRLAGTVPAPGRTAGGAIHVEDQTTLAVDASVFTDNLAEFGGAVDSYRAIVEVRGSRFERNRAPLAGAPSAGGSLGIQSLDNSDASTNFGAINRRPASLMVSDTLIRGDGGPVAHTGGCLFATGDEHRVFGASGVPPAGTEAENRARVVLSRTAFSGCQVQKAADGTGGTGGAIQLGLVDLHMDDVLVIDSRAPVAGGALAVGRGAGGVIEHTTFARNVSEAGGAVQWVGSTVQIAHSVFLGNQATDGRGGAIFARPATDPTRPRDVGGAVADSIFTANLGTPLFDNQPPTGPSNTVSYDRNQFHLASGTAVYAHNLLAPGGLSAAELNNLPHKSAGGNVRLTSAPRLGSVLATPPFLGAGAPGSPAASFLAYAWSGHSATLLGQPLTAKAGLLAVSTPGEHELIVDGGVIDTARMAASACSSGPVLCLGGDRFVAKVRFVAAGRTGSGQAAALTSDTGTFWFFDAANVELVVKVLDGRAINGRFWVFYGALTDVEYTLTITDTVSGRLRTYHNPAGKMASAADTSAFPAGAAATSAASVAGVEPPAAPLVEQDIAAASTCAPGPTDLCVGGRFRVVLQWKAQGQQGSGKAVSLTSDTGYFWFFSPSNVEVILKVLDGRPVNGHFWVFYGALSDVEYQITVIDTQTGRQKVYSNPAGRMASVGDTSALSD